MERFQGKLAEGDQVIMSRVEGLIERKSSPENSWSGHFSLPESLVGPVHVGKSYLLDVKKGVALRIVVNRIRHGAGGNPIAEFHTTENSTK